MCCLSCVCRGLHKGCCKGPLGSKSWVEVSLWTPEPLDAAWKDFRDHLVQSCFPEGETEAEETCDFPRLVTLGNTVSAQVSQHCGHHPFFLQTVLWTHPLHCGHMRRPQQQHSSLECQDFMFTPVSPKLNKMPGLEWYVIHVFELKKKSSLLGYSSMISLNFESKNHLLKTTVSKEENLFLAMFWGLLWSQDKHVFCNSKQAGYMDVWIYMCMHTYTPHI